MWVLMNKLFHIVWNEHSIQCGKNVPYPMEKSCHKIWNV